MKLAIKNLSLGLGLILSLLFGSALPMNSGTQLKDKLDNLNGALRSLQRGLQKLSTQLGTLKGSLGGTHAHQPSTMTSEKDTSSSSSVSRSGESTAGFLGKKTAKKSPYEDSVDFLEIPNFEDFYQAFNQQYLQPELKKAAYYEWAHGDVYPWKLVNGVLTLDSKYTGQAGVKESLCGNIEEYIGRAYFEKYILDYCRDHIIEILDRDRKKSGQNQLWVYQGDDNACKLKDVIQDVLDKKQDPKEGIKNVLMNAAKDIAQAVNDIFYHRERNPLVAEKDLPLYELDMPEDSLDDTTGFYGRGNAVSCECLITPLTTGSRGMRSKKKIPYHYILRLPITYLLFETMHITLFHGVPLFDRMISLFDFEKDIDADVFVKNKTLFRVGFDGEGKVFSDIFGTIVGDEKQIRDHLFILPQRKNYGNKDEVKLRDGKNREVIYGKRDPETYWSQRSDDIFPDGNPHPDKRDKDGSSLSDSELLYALKLHIDRHTCYSVGLIPYNFIHLLKLPQEKEDMVKMKIGEAVRNLKEKNRLKGLVRVPKIIEYLAPALKLLKNVKNSAFMGPQIFDVFNNMKDQVSSLSASGNMQPININSIVPSEWEMIFDQLKQDERWDDIKKVLEMGRNPLQSGPLGNAPIAGLDPKVAKINVAVALYEAFDKVK